MKAPFVRLATYVTARFVRYKGTFHQSKDRIDSLREASFLRSPFLHLLPKLEARNSPASQPDCQQLLTYHLILNNSSKLLLAYQPSTLGPASDSPLPYIQAVPCSGFFYRHFQYALPRYTSVDIVEVEVNISRPNNNSSYSHAACYQYHINFVVRNPTS